jgi:hypothetical protein
MSLTDIFAVIALVVSLLSFAFTYRVMRAQFTEDTGADLHEAVMRLIEIQGSMPDHPNTSRNAINQVHHLALMVESLIEQGGDDLRVPITGYLALGWSFDLVGEDEKAERHHRTACDCGSADTPFSRVLTRRSLGRYYFNRGRGGDLDHARDAYAAALNHGLEVELDRDDAAEMDVYTLVQWARHESKRSAMQGSLDSHPHAPLVLERARECTARVEDPVRREKLEQCIEEADSAMIADQGGVASTDQALRTTEFEDYPAI